MTPVSKFIRNALERILDRYYEGPRAPDRIREMVVGFANECPRATRADWIAFATHHASEFYRAGFIRGSEWAERDFLTRMPSVRPEEIMDLEDPNWRWHPGITLEGEPERVVVDEQEGQGR